MVSPSPAVKKVHLLDLTSSELEKKIIKLSGEKYRFKQLCDWVFNQRAASFEQMSNLPESFRGSLSRHFLLRSLELLKEEHSEDGTAKFTFRADDKKFISAVFLPHKDHNSLCISTQVGCAWGCRFCASGLLPFMRNLSSAEILDQIFLSEELKKERIQNVLFMGMGEPLANYDATVTAIRWLTSRFGFMMSPSRITVSTTGIAPLIRKMAGEHLKVNLALSLHAADDAVRGKIMPFSARYEIKELLLACRDYQEKNSSDFTVEYILLKGINDGLDDAKKLSELLLSMRFKEPPKINLVPHNPIASIPYGPPEPEKVKSFFNMLKRHRFVVHTRKARGQDIKAACGQLQ